MVDESATWVGATARDIARAVRRGDTSATQVVADHLDYIQAYDETVNAFRVIRAAAAITEAEAVDEQEDLANLPLAGVPIAVKENTPVAGVPTWYGSAAARAGTAEADHEVVRRLRGAGAVVVGTTRMPELGLWALTDDETAITRNPWRTDRTPGGSSGGAAAAVAAGLVPIAHGNDGLGSVRIPAACCGLVGIKPGRGVVPAQLPEPGRLRLAVSARSPLVGVRVDKPNRDAVRNAARLLVAAGHDTVTANPAYPTVTGLRIVATWLAAACRDLEESGVDQAALQPRTRRHAALGERIWRRGLVREKDRAAWRAACEKWFSDGGYDVLLTPALAGSPPPAVDWHARAWRGSFLTSLRFAPFAGAWNFAGFPGMVVPMGVRPDGLPVAVQLIGPPGSELTLLGLAGQLEQASPWLRHAPGWPKVGATISG